MSQSLAAAPSFNLHFHPQFSSSSKPQNPRISQLSFPTSSSYPFLTRNQPLPNKPIITSSSSSVSNDDPLFSLSSLLCPSLAYANAYFFKSGIYNVQVLVSENEPEDKLVNRFRREVLRAGILQETKRRKFCETNQEKRKRKTRDAARRFRKRRPLAKASQDSKEEVVKKRGYKSEDDCWEFQDVVELPYC